jgi:predicted DNA-binding protein (MmcQ/YjbR family)
LKPFNAALEKMREICLCPPDTKETPTWGKPHFRVGEKIFAGLGKEKGVLSVGFRPDLDHADAMVRRPGFSRAPYVGHKGWVSVDVGRVSDRGELRSLIHESYRLIAPKKTLAKWQSESATTTPRGSVRVNPKTRRRASPPKTRRPPTKHS